MTALLRKMLGQADARATLRAGYYTGNFTPEWYEEHYREFNTLPPDQTMFCHECGAATKWIRSAPSFNVRDGRPGHTYRFRCSAPRDPLDPFDRHYDSGKYLWLARNDDVIATDEIASEDYGRA